MLCSKAVLFGFAAIFLTVQWSHGSNLGSDNVKAEPRDYGSADLQPDRYQHSANYALRRTRSTCVVSGYSCDHQPNNCCKSLACRCNLWGSNCRCQKMGL